MRLFIAVPLPAAVVAELSAISLQLRSSGDGLRWSAPETWHITLQFLGETDQEHYDCVVPRLRELRLKPVPVQLDGLGFFDRAGVFFAGVAVAPELILLQRRVTESTKACGFLPEERAFQPHITLARSRDREQGLAGLKARIRLQPRFSQIVAEEFLLYESFLGPAGAQHEVRQRFPLHGQ
jgi:RNA 2',3'-cyclic 3'-phosphodiesterase